MKQLPREQRNSFLFSVAFHAIAIIVVATIGFQYPLLVFGTRSQPATEEHIQLVTVGPRAPVGNGADPNAAPPRGAPAPLRAPTTVPIGIPPVPPPSSTAGAASGQVGGRGGAPVGMATGIEPALPDPRIALEPGTFNPLPKTPAQRVDSAVRSVFQRYQDSVRTAQGNAPRDPTDWTVERNGRKWGMDPQNIYIGNIKIPTALLALIPNSMGPRESPVDTRSRAFIRQDVLEHAQQAISEDEFRMAVRRIRERRDRQHSTEGQTVPGAVPAGAMPEHGGSP